ncbi:MAG: rod shape-determining protein MreC, partial [Verrucomicrobiota bacterium]
MFVPWKPVLRWILACTVVLLLAAMIFVGPVNGAASSFLRPLLQFTQVVRNRLSETMEGLVAGRRLRSDLRRLEAELAVLELELGEARQARAENEKLRAILDLPAAPEWRRIVAPVIARDPVEWRRGFRIGKGTRDGIALGAVVMERNNVIGRVIQVHRTTATVATVADPACRISVRVRGTDAVGLMGGVRRIAAGGLPQCIVTYLPRDADYRRGQVVQTTGLGETIPGGLTVGRVVPWSEQQLVDVRDNSYARIAVAPLADFGRVRFVSVLSL